MSVDHTLQCKEEASLPSLPYRQDSRVLVKVLTPGEGRGMQPTLLLSSVPDPPEVLLPPREQHICATGERIGDQSPSHMGWQSNGFEVPKPILR